MNLIKPYYSGLSPQRCHVCSDVSNLKICSGCQAVHYCGPSHQTTDRPKHKATCNKIKKTREKLEEEESSLRTRPANLFLPEDVFTNCVGQFWGILDTRDYMRARFAAASALLEANTLVSVERALEHFNDMLRLCRSDNMGIRDLVPSVMLQLGREQECYDFLKWWAAVPDSNYDWGDMSLPYLNIHNADALEPLDKLDTKGLSLAQLASLTLLKLRLYLDFEAMEQKALDALTAGMSAWGYHDDEDDSVLDRPLGQIAKALEQSGDMPNLSWAAQRLKTQYLSLCQTVFDTNKHFWEALIDAEKPPLHPYYSHGSREEADLAVLHCKASWEESEDALVTVEADTSQWVSVYAGAQAAATSTGDSGSRRPAASWPIRRGTGKVFPTEAIRSTPGTMPGDLFNLNPSTDGAAARFLHRNHPSSILLYTDGACLNNGQSNPRAGWAVVYGPGDNIVSGRLEEEGPFGDKCLATSNRAELRAVIAALQFCDWKADGFDSITIATDSSYAVEGATSWTRGWLRNGWKTRVREDVKNKDLWEALLGDVERLAEQGLTVKLWRIPRGLNTEADLAAKTAASKTPVAKFNDVPMSPQAAATANTPSSGRIIALCVEEEAIFDACFGSLVKGISSKATMERATTLKGAIRLLSHGDRPSVILVTDGAVTRQKTLFDCVADCLLQGSTVVLCGCFSGMVSGTEFSRFFTRLGLPWVRGSYHRATVNLRRGAVGDQLASRLPKSYSQKALFVEKLDRSAMWYTEKESSDEAAVALTKVGQGMLGYIGDVNGEEPSTAVVMALCGLLD